MERWHSHANRQLERKYIGPQKSRKSIEICVFLFFAHIHVSKTVQHFVQRILKLAPSSIIWYLFFWRGVTIPMLTLSSIKYRLDNFKDISSRRVYLNATFAFARWHGLLLTYVKFFLKTHLDFINCSVWSSDNKRKILNIMLTGWLMYISISYRKMVRNVIIFNL